MPDAVTSAVGTSASVAVAVTVSKAMIDGAGGTVDVPSDIGTLVGDFVLVSTAGPVVSVVGAGVVDGTTRAVDVGAVVSDEAFGQFASTAHVQRNCVMVVQFCNAGSNPTGRHRKQQERTKQLPPNPL